jgi:hypothetical protein
VSRVNENVVAALKAAVSEANQPKELAQRLVSWLDALATGNAEITDESEAAKRISDLLDLVRVTSEELDLGDQTE